MEAFSPPWKAWNTYDISNMGIIVDSDLNLFYIVVGFIWLQSEKKKHRWSRLSIFM